MLKLLSIFSYFFKELIFESKEEYDFKSSKFNMRKFLVFSIILMSIFLNIFLMNRVYRLALANTEYKKTLRTLTENYQALEEKSKQMLPSDSQKDRNKARHR